MKVAFLSTFYPYRGGIAQFSASLYREFERAHEVRAFTFTRQYPDFLFPGDTQYVTEGDAADPVPAVRVLDSINPLSYRRTAAQIRAFDPDLLLLRFWMPFFAPSHGWVAAGVRKHGTTVIAILDNIVPHERRPGDALLTRYFLRRCDGFVAMSRVVEQDLRRLLPGARSIVKPHPLYDHFGAAISKQQARQQLDLPSGKKILLFFGFIRDYKGLDTLIRCMALLPDDYLLVVAGEMYGDFAGYQRLIDDTGTAAKISLFVRYINDAEVPLFFSAADVGVLPYKSATQSGIAQIAFNYDLPLIATDVGGLGEMITAGETGLLIDSQEPAALAAAVRQYFEHNLQQPFARAIAERKASYSWPGFAEAVLQLYREIRAADGGER